jgi:alkanesulfonate monooxygenase SsuD/methylene tetrahydromethanopterin reductase-like flavin-dependent oxidoreductase (luciferase family)
VIERWHGVPYRSPLARTESYVKFIRSALAGEPVEYCGPDFHLSGFPLAARMPAPVPIYTAALGPKNVRLAGRIADGWLPIFAARGRMTALLSHVRDGAEEAERDFHSIDVAAYIPLLVGPPRRSAPRAAAGTLHRRYGGVLRQTFLHGTSPEEAAATLEAVAPAP